MLTEASVVLAVVASCCGYTLALAVRAVAEPWRVHVGSSACKTYSRCVEIKLAYANWLPMQLLQSGLTGTGCCVSCWCFGVVGLIRGCDCVGSSFERSTCCSAEGGQLICIVISVYLSTTVGLTGSLWPGVWRLWPECAGVIVCSGVLEKHRESVEKSV